MVAARALSRPRNQLRTRRLAGFSIQWNEITDQTAAASKRGINGTPTFELNGVRLAAITARDVLFVLENAIKR